MNSNRIVRDAIHAAQRYAQPGNGEGIELIHTTMEPGEVSVYVSFVAGWRPGVIVSP